MSPVLKSFSFFLEPAGGIPMPQYASYVLTWGRHKGQTLAQIDAAEDRGYIRWIAANAHDAGERAIAQVYLDSAATEWEAGCKAPALAIVPESEQASKDLSLGGKVLYTAIYTAADRDPGHRCRLGNDELADATGLSTKHVKRLLQELEVRQGLIARDMRDAAHRDALVITWQGRQGGHDVQSARTSCPPWEGSDLTTARMQQVDETREHISRPIRWRGRPYERDGQAVMRHRRDRRAGVPSDGYASPGPKGDE
jgi:hypothetical protein